MPELLTTLQTISSVQSRIVALGTSLPKDGSRTQKDFEVREGPALIEIAQELRGVSISSQNTAESRSKSTSKTPQSFPKAHNKVDSTAFLNQTYLTSSSSPSPLNDLSDDACEILKSQPNQEDLLAVLQYLQCGIDNKHDFNIRAPSAKTSQITNALVNVTVVDHWHRLDQKRLSHEDKQLKQYLLSCLSSVTGLGALLAQVKKSSIPTTAANSKHALQQDMISVLGHILSPISTIDELIKVNLGITEKTTLRHVIWQELVSLLAGSKILTTIAQASGARKVDDEDKASVSWLGDGPRYCTWLAKNIAYAATSLFVKETEAWSMLAQITRRGFSLGHRDSFVADIYTSLLLGHKASWTAMHELLRSLPRWEQKAFFDGMMRDVVKNHMRSNVTGPMSLSSSPIMPDYSIEAVASLVAGVMENNGFLQDYVVEWLVDDNGANASIGLPARRAVIATLSNHEGKLQKTLDRCLELLSDKLQIQHSSILQQEATVQTMLLAVAYLNRTNRNLIKDIARSSSYIHAVSNRLGSSIPRARYLGMIIGVAISRLVDEPGKMMDFGAEEMDSEEAKAWLNLVNVHDKIGSLDAIQETDRTITKMKKKPSMSKKPTKKPAAKQPTTSKIISIEEVEDSESEDDNLVPHAKPDDDPSDSEEDPTLIDRSRPVASVYILDLIKGLNANEKPEVVQLALKTAPSLIRRKAGFGTEVSENIDRLASSLLNLSEGMSKAQPQKLRLQALIACVVALPERMGPWLASMYFEGDFSLVQRATLLTTIGLGCREVAGYTEDPAVEQPSSFFPSKSLPDKLSALYTPIDSITSSLSRATLQPMALTAADTLTGPNILKVRTFSSRLAVSEKVTAKSTERSMRIPKHLHKLLVESFFLPLCCRMSLLLSSRPSITRSTVFEPHIFKLFLQTLAIILSTLGPHATQLHTITRETLLLLTQLHSTSALSLDPAILPPTLQLLLSLLDLNIEAGTVAEERLVTDFGPSIAELMAWIGGLGDMRVPEQEGEGLGMPWTVIAAGCQVKWQEVGRKYQGRMVGLTPMDGF